MSNTDTWQLCPKCNGSGSYASAWSTGTQCDVCLGRKIISKITGLPPVGTPSYFIPTTTSSFDSNRECCGRCIPGMDDCILDTKRAEEAIDNAIKHSV